MRYFKTFVVADPKKVAYTEQLTWYYARAWAAVHFGGKQTEEVDASEIEENEYNLNTKKRPGKK